MSSTHPPIVALGSMDRHILEHLREISLDGATSNTSSFIRPENAESWLDDGNPGIIVVDADSPDAQTLCAKVRSSVIYSHLPLVGLATRVDDLKFLEFFGWGGEDLTPKHSPQQLTSRIRHIQSATSSFAEPPPVQGDAIVADGERQTRILTARLLRNAGYDVKFALDGEETVRAACDPHVRLVVVQSALSHEEGLLALRKARKLGSTANWIFVTEPRRIPRMQSALAGQPNVSIADAFAPPESILFVANDLTRPDAIEARSSSRLVYGTTVAFRLAGRHEDEQGFSFNVSASGLYIRTLAMPPEHELLWLELLPPRSERRVRLEGEIMWRRVYGPDANATVPVGFGVQITGGLSGDRERFRMGYEALLADFLGIGDLE